MPRSIDDLLVEARAVLNRVTPAQAKTSFGNGALLVDIRPQHQRAREGEIPGSLFIERNVLEWRFDLQGQWHLSEVTNYEQPIIVICSEGYTSSLAAAALQDLGFVNATDMDGGFKAWEAAGFSTQPGGTPPIA